MNVEVQAILFPYDGSRTVAVIKEFESALEAAGVRCVVGNMAVSCYGEMETVLSAINKAYQVIAVADRLSVSLVIANDMPQIGRKT
ncbi:MAG: hypothetical protein NTW63_00390 [Caldiserica bacterium]|nr:hypothetical protein [Caldisericota bacterium]